MAATLGLGAPAASAYTPMAGGDSNGVLNVSDNNIGPVQVCNNDVPVNVIGGQVPISDVAGVLGILSHGNTAVVENECETGDYHAD